MTTHDELHARAESVIRATSELSADDKQFLLAAIEASNDELLETFLFLYEEDSSGIGAFVTKIRRWLEVKGDSGEVKKLIDEDKRDLIQAFA